MKRRSMPTTVNIPPDFQNQIKHLKKRYRKVTDDVRDLVLRLQTDERPGDLVPDVGYEGVYKARIRNRSARRGVQGGFRVVYYAQVENVVFLLLIYSKTEIDNIPAHEIRDVLERVVPPPSS